MPSGGIRVDENTLGFAKEADDFMSLASAGLTNRDTPVFWRELSCDPERVQSFAVCLIVKLISLDGGQGKLNLSKNYCELCGLDTEVSCLKTWMSKEKPLDQERKHLALLLQHQIISTLYFLKQFYRHMPSNHLKHMHIRWSLARNCVRSENAERCDHFEVMVMKDYYRFGAEVPKVINPVDPRLLVEILEASYKHHRRGQLGYLPPRFSKLCNYREVVERSLAYYRLHFIVSGNQSLVSDTITELVSVLKKCSIDTADHGEKEELLPVFQLLHHFIVEAVKYNTGDVYRAVQPFYLWPTPHCDVAKSLLDVMQAEDIRRGSAFREKLIAEQHYELNLGTSVTANPILNRRYYHHVLVDTHASRSYTFSQAFENQEVLDPVALKKLLLRNLFRSLLQTGVDLAKLDEQLEGMVNQLDSLCSRALRLVFASEEDGISGISKSIIVDLRELYSEIMSHVPEYPITDQSPLTPEQLEDFSLPDPHFHTHHINKISLSVVKDKLKEIIAHPSGKSHRPKKFSGRRTAKLSSLSQDSGTDDHEYIPSPEDNLSPKSYPVRPSSAPTSRIHSISETGDLRAHPETMNGPTSPIRTSRIHSVSETGDLHPETLNDPTSPMRSSRIHSISETGNPQGHPGTVSGPTSPLPPPRSPSSPTISFSSSQPEPFDDPTSSSDPPSESASVNSNTSASRSRSQSPSGSENGYATFISSHSTFPRPSLPDHMYGSVNRIRTESWGRRNSSPIVESVTRSGTLVRKQKKNGMNTIRPVRKRSIAVQSFFPKVLKIVLAGDDKMINNVASAYTELRITEPSLFTGLQIQFFYVPLSEVSTATQTTLNDAKSIDSADHLIQPLIDSAQPSLHGEDVWLGCFLGNMDSWYERNVLLATHNLLRIIPSPEKLEKSSHLTLPAMTPSAGLPKVTEKLSPSPAQLLRSLVTNYCREGQNTIRFNMYSVELEVKPDKTSVKSKSQHHMEYTNYHYMLQRVDMQRCKGKQVKTFEAKVSIEEVTLDCTRLERRTFSVKNIWSVGVASVPRVYDLHVNNPEHDNVELTVTQATTEGKLSTSHKLSDENSYHVRSVEVETKEKPFSVMINGVNGDHDPSRLIENVTKVTIKPAMAGEREDSFLTSSSMDEQQTQKQVYFPLMSFWPVDL